MWLRGIQKQEWPMLHTVPRLCQLYLHCVIFPCNAADSEDWQQRCGKCKRIFWDNSNFFCDHDVLFLAVCMEDKRKRGYGTDTDSRAAKIFDCTEPEGSSKKQISYSADYHNNSWVCGNHGAYVNIVLFCYLLHGFLYPDFPHVYDHVGYMSCGDSFYVYKYFHILR